MKYDLLFEGDAWWVVDPDNRNFIHSFELDDDVGVKSVDAQKKAFCWAWYLGDDIQRNFRKNRHSPVLVKPNLRRFTLPNGERVKVGDHLYDISNNREFGEVIDITDNNMVVNNNKGSVEFVKLEQAEHLVTMPF